MTPGPLIRAQKGRYTIVRQINGFKDVEHPTLRYEPHVSVHLHGSASLPEYDGYASDVIKPGEYKEYHYPNIQDARTLWYHDHGIHQTASNAYMGLAAQYHHLHDANEASLGIPSGNATTSRSQSATRSSTPGASWSTTTTASRRSWAT
jgi:spore coat protein A